MRNTILLLALLLIGGPIHAQNKKSDKKTTITIVNEENGKRTVIDTTFINADQETIDAFLQAQGMNKPVPPPAPPAPPVPPGKMKHGVPPVPPVPPAPPAPEDESSFNFHFEMPDIDIDIEKELEKAQEALEKAREVMEKELSKEKLQEMREDIQKNLKELEKEIEKAGKSKKVIIRSKTGNVDTDPDNTTGYIYNYSSPAYSYSYTLPSYSYGYSSAGNELEPLVDLNDLDTNIKIGCNGNSYAYSYPYVVVNHKSKFRKLVDKVVNWILE